MHGKGSINKKCNVILRLVFHEIQTNLRSVEANQMLSWRETLIDLVFAWRLGIILGHFLSCECGT